MTLAVPATSSSSVVGPAKELRVELAARLPIDPLYMKAMAEYDLSLMLWRSWFNYDKGRRAENGVIKRWIFDNKTGEYKFELEEMKWSDGSALTSDHLIANLKRISKSSTSYAKALNSIVDIDSLKEIAPNSFAFRTKSRKPSDTLFNQFGSVFFSIVHPKDLDESGTRLKQNSLALGPYKIEKIEKEQMSFVRNPYFKTTNFKSPERILVRPLSPDFSLEKFLKGKVWSNYYQTNTLLNPDTAKAIRSSKAPLWTRGFDRVALLRPLGSGPALQTRRQLIKALGFAAGKSSLPQHPLQVSLAKSLQPLGYPLFKPLSYPETKSPLKKVKILSYKVPQLDLIRPWLDQLTQGLGILLEWQVLDQQKFLSTDWDKSGNDLVLFSFGVADPEPTTWLGLVLGSRFISYESVDHKRFESLTGVQDTQRQVEGYQDLLTDIALNGGYLPLFHGATFSIGRPGMNFDLVDPLDETVDYSKIQFAD